MIPFLKPDLPPWLEVLPELEEVYKTGKFHPGKYVERFESAVCEKLGVREAVMVSTGSDGLILLMAWAAAERSIRITRRLQPIVLGTDFTFRATPQAAWWNDLRYVPIDCDGDGNMSVSNLEQAFGVYPDTSAVLATHVFGLPCDVHSLQRVAREHGVPLIFDAAHALGASVGGTYVGNFGKAECFSLNITKCVPSCGEGGLITTNDGELAHWLRKTRWHGDIVGSLDWTVPPGMNAKPTEWQAIVAYHALAHMDQVIGARNTVARWYWSGLNDSRRAIEAWPLQPWLGLINTLRTSAWKDFAVLASGVDERDRICAALEQKEIGFKNYFKPIVSQMKAHVGSIPGNPNATDLAERIICLPIYSTLTSDEVSTILHTMEHAI